MNSKQHSIDFLKIRASQLRRRRRNCDANQTIESEIFCYPKNMSETLFQLKNCVFYNLFRKCLTFLSCIIVTMLITVFNSIVVRLSMLFKTVFPSCLIVTMLTIVLSPLLTDYTSRLRMCFTLALYSQCSQWYLTPLWRRDCTSC